MKNTAIKIHPFPSDQGPVEKEVGQLSLDILKKDKEIIIVAPIAGVSENDITLAITDDVLVIKGIRVNKNEVPEEDYYTKECFWGNFSRSIVLPPEADTKNISAVFENNILEIHIPRREIEQTKIIKIKS